MSKKPTVLMILDGYGLNDKCEHNAVCEAKTPIMDQLMSQCPYVKGQASGLAVGLPDGQMGNSEVGHLTAVFTATSPTYSDFWSWQNVRVSRKFMYTASWMAVTLLRHPENPMLSSCRQKWMRSVSAKSA